MTAQQWRWIGGVVDNDVDTADVEGRGEDVEAGSGIRSAGWEQVPDDVPHDGVVHVLLSHDQWAFVRRCLVEWAEVEADLAAEQAAHPDSGDENEYHPEELLRIEAVIAAAVHT